MDKLIFADEFIPVKEEAVRSILDYEIEIYALSNEDKQYSALNMNYSVAGFKLVLARKMSFYVVTYYLPSGLFVVVSWISFLVNPEVIICYPIILTSSILSIVIVINLLQDFFVKGCGNNSVYFLILAIKDV